MKVIDKEKADRLLHPSVPVIIRCVVSLAVLFVLFLIFPDKMELLTAPSCMFATYVTAVIIMQVPPLAAKLRTAVTDGSIRPIAKARELAERFPVAKALIYSRDLRAVAALYLGFGANTLYGIIKLIMGLYYASMWFFAAGIYYLALAGIKFMLMKRGRAASGADRSSRTLNEYRAYRFCGVLMLILNSVMVGMIVQMVHNGEVNTYSRTLIVVIAFYTFCYFINSVINMRRFHRRSPILSAAKNITFCSAMMSMYSLQAAMFAVYDSDPGFIFVMNSSVGGAVSIAVIATALYMIANSTLYLRKHRVGNRLGS